MLKNRLRNFQTIISRIHAHHIAYTTHAERAKEREEHTHVFEQSTQHISANAKVSGMIKREKEQDRMNATM